MPKPPKSNQLSSVERRAVELDTIASVLPIERRDELAELLTDRVSIGTQNLHAETHIIWALLAKGGVYGAPVAAR